MGEGSQVDIIILRLKKNGVKIHEINKTRWGAYLSVEWINVKNKNPLIESKKEFKNLDIYHDGLITVSSLGIGCFAQKGKEYLIEGFVESYNGMIKKYQEEDNQSKGLK